jgi:hypothetical protein
MITRINIILVEARDSCDSLCSADTTTPTFYRKAGPGGSTPPDYPNEYRPGGSTATKNHNSTPASNASTRNANSPADTDDQPKLHDRLLD